MKFFPIQSFLIIETFAHSDHPFVRTQKVVETEEIFKFYEEIK